jgi:hypothetical protein
MYGKTDEVPGLFHVATRFGHLWFLPLIPVGSYVIVKKTEEGWRGVRIPVSVKSLVLAWLRTACLIIGLVSAGFGLLDPPRDPGDHTTMLIIAVSAVAGFLILKYARPFRYARYERARVIAEQAGFGVGMAVLLQLQYGLIEKREADALLADIVTDEIPAVGRHAAEEEETAGE